MTDYIVQINDPPGGGASVYVPADQAVKTGDRVAWKNNSAIAHTATSDDDGNSFDTDVIRAGTTSDYQTINNNPGPVPYHCTIHPATMKAKLTVS
jgi:plastocyanin